MCYISILECYIRDCEGSELLALKSYYTISSNHNAEIGRFSPVEKDKYLVYCNEKTFKNVKRRI